MNTSKEKFITVEMLSQSITILKGLLPNTLQKGFTKSSQDKELKYASEILPIC